MDLTTLNRKYLSPDDLLLAARSKFLSAKTLLSNPGYELEGEHYGGDENAVYLAGYALEFMLKRHIALQLGWDTYPPKYIGTKREGYVEENDDKSFKVHDLNRLLILAGLYETVTSDTEVDSYWQTAVLWQASMRYCEHSPFSHSKAHEIIDSLLYMIQWVKQQS